MPRYLKILPLLLVLAYMLVFAVTRHPSQEWDRIIDSDGKAYYAYLPALFIYHDAEYHFTEWYEVEYYPDDLSAMKEYRMPYKGRVLNKTYPGMAIVWLPFFLMAHLIALMTPLPADGYSVIYQLFIGLSSFVFFFIGLHKIRAWLYELRFSPLIISLVLISVALATNLIYYTVNEGSMSHVFSFGLVSAFCYHLHRAANRPEGYNYLFALALFLLIILVRPLNVLLVLCLPFITYGFNPFFRLLVGVFTDFRKYLPAVLIFLLALSIPLTLWYWQTGYVYAYSYGDEGFNFADPHILDLLFSYRKGWFLYTPIAFVSLFGLAALWRQSRSAVYSFVLFFCVYVYIASSWWVWDYTSRFSQRIFVDFLPFFALLLAFLLRDLLKRNRLITGIVLFLIILLNIFQYYQSWIWVYPDGPVTKESYWKYFFSTKALARFMIDDSGIISKTGFHTSLEAEDEWYNTHSLTKQKAYLGECSAEINIMNPTSPVVHKLVKPFWPEGKMLVRYSAWLFADDNSADPRFVISSVSKGQTLKYNAFPAYRFLNSGQWTYCEFGAEVPFSDDPGLEVKAYIYMTDTTSSVFVDEISLEFICVEGTAEALARNKMPENAELYSEQTLALDQAAENTEAFPGNYSLKGGDALRIFPESKKELHRISPDDVPPGMDYAVGIHTFVLSSSDDSLLISLEMPGTNKGALNAFFLNPYIKKNTWTYCEFASGHIMSSKEYPSLFFINKSKKNVYLDETTINVYSLDGLSEEDDASDFKQRNAKVLMDVEHDMDSYMHWKDESCLQFDTALFGKGSCRLDSLKRYGLAFEKKLSPSCVKDMNGLSVAFYANTNLERSKALFVIELKKKGNRLLYLPVYFNGKTRKNEWTYINRYLTIPELSEKPEELFLYFWNPSADEILYLDNLRMSLLRNNEYSTAGSKY